MIFNFVQMVMVRYSFQMTKNMLYIPVVVEPLLEDLDGLLGQVAAALAAGRGAARLPRAAGVLLRGGVLVRRGTGVPLSLAN